MDRNNKISTVNITREVSLSARRAWIEMFSVREVFANFEVALRKESVDRNMLCTSVCFVGVGSLSARRAWIEIGAPQNKLANVRSRSPQGERG